MQLRPDVHAARVDEDIVLLDVGVGEYLCLADAAEAFALTPQAPARIVDPELAQEAAALGLVGDGHTAPMPVVVRAAADLQASHECRPGYVTTFKAFAAFGVLLRHYYGRPFPQLVEYARRRRLSAQPQLTPALIETIQVFHRLLPWAPFQGVCLYRSFFLLAFLRQHGLDAIWVFGVRTWPFEAHCWLQVDDVVLDDRIDHVRPFAPIFAV